MNLVFVVLFLTMGLKGPVIMVATDPSLGTAKDGSALQIEYADRAECEAARPGVIANLAQINPGQPILESKCQETRTEKEWV
jgi:hypothetical protein